MSKTTVERNERAAVLYNPKENCRNEKCRMEEREKQSFHVSDLGALG